MTPSLDAAPPRRASSLIGAPAFLLAAVCAVLAVLLLVPMTLPIGPNNWDLYLYFDAANRILSGQVPGVDFFPPVGPLGYWLFTLMVSIFAKGQPLFVVQWSMLLVTAPLLAVVLVDVDRRSRALALALLVPFLIFSILPVNVEQYYSYPGVDSFGIYNRQTCQILYVLVAALVFAERRATLLVAISGTMLALFLVKITGFVSGGMICLFALAAGRVPLKTAILSAAIFLLVLLGLQLSTGIVSAYLGDIAMLISRNEDSLLPRFLQAISIQFLAVGPLAALVATLLIVGGREIAAAGGALLKRPSLAHTEAFFDRDAFWVGAISFAALFFETQNTGSQGFIMVWPTLLAVILHADLWKRRTQILVLSLVAACAMPTVAQVVQRSARALIGQIKYEDLRHDHLGTLGAFSQRPEIMERAAVMIEAYREFPDTWQFLADRQQLPTFTLYTEADFQLTWLKAIDEAVGAIEAYEAANGVRFTTIMSLNFVNPFPWLLHRQAPRHIAIGADPYRTVPVPDAEIIAAVDATDLVLYPRCPVTNANEALLALYEPGLSGHRRITLSPCWDAFVKTR